LRLPAFCCARGFDCLKHLPKNQNCQYLWAVPMATPASRKWLLLLAVPFLALLCTPLYSRLTPAIFGFPFFYWYQFLWIPLSATITFLVYWKSGR